MKLLRLKITDPAGFRSLRSGFEHHFRNESDLQEESDSADEGFAPFICAGPNGSGKSNLLEALAAIFYQLEVQRTQRSFLPRIFEYDPEGNPDGIKDGDGSPNAYELEYLIGVPDSYRRPDSPQLAHVKVIKEPGRSPGLTWLNSESFSTDGLSTLTDEERGLLVPEYVLGYSSGENEILSLPFFKLRFVQFDEYWNSLQVQLDYPGHPETRLAYLDNGFSQAIFLCNLLMQDASDLQPFREDVGIETLREFRIVLRRSIPLEQTKLEAFDYASDDQRRERSNRLRAENPRSSDSELQELISREIVKNNPALKTDVDESGVTRYRVNLLHGLDGDDTSPRMVSALRRCATLSYHDETTDTLILDYRVNDATKEAFRENFDFATFKSPLGLFRAFQVLLTLNLYAVSDTLKADLYRSNSHYVSETVPTLASDQRIMRFKLVRFSKRGLSTPMMLKELSDGEHQLLHSLGLCLLFRNTRSLFLLDEPETHFNPDWRANFISRLRQCLPGSSDTRQEMLITTHTPFLISDSRREKVLVFSKDEATGDVSVRTPEFNTLGASINKITMSEVFGKRETIGAYAQSILERKRARFEAGNEDPSALIDDINRELGDSVEKILLVKAILGSAEGQALEEQG